MKSLEDEIKWNIITTIIKVIVFKPELIDQVYDLTVEIRHGISHTVANI